jgi:hypothetical protein
MTNLGLARTVAALAAISFGLAVSAAAAAPSANRAWVSGHGVDQAGCGAPASPCRSFQYAHDNIVAAGGEIDVLDPAGFGAITITKALSIVNDGVGTAGVQQATAGQNAITIDAGKNDAVFLRGLTVEGVGTGVNGLLFNTGARLDVTNCIFRNFSDNGVRLAPTGAMSFSISKTIAGNNAADGVYIAPVGAGSASGAIVNLEANGNGYIGIGLDGQFLTSSVASSVTIVASVASGNGNTGISVQGGAMSAVVRDTAASANSFAGFVTTLGGGLWLSHVVATGNAQGVSSGGTVHTYGDNSIVGNGTDINATLASVTPH